MRDNRNEAYDNAMKTAKRIAITMLCCVPFLIVFAYLFRNVIHSNGLQIFLFVLIMGVAVLIEELIYRMKAKSKTEIDDDKKDVFK